jgi:hypothetical protein
MIQRKLLRKITSEYGGTCGACSKYYEAGEEVYWGSKVLMPDIPRNRACFHLNCIDNQATLFEEFRTRWVKSPDGTWKVSVSQDGRTWATIDFTETQLQTFLKRGLDVLEAHRRAAQLDEKGGTESAEESILGQEAPTPQPSGATDDEWI